MKKWGEELEIFNGVVAFSNGECTGNPQDAKSPNGKPCIEELKYQCVDYAKRYHKSITEVQDPWGSAWEFWMRPKYEQLVRFVNQQARERPQPGDMLFFRLGEYGHVAIIMEAGDNTIKVIQQNWDRNTAIGPITLTKTAGGFYSLGDQLYRRRGGSTGHAPVVGWLRAKAPVVTQPPPRPSSAPCEQYLGKGYSTDYVRQRYPSIPLPRVGAEGGPLDWLSNPGPLQKGQEPRVGAIAVVDVPGVPRGHTGIVDSVAPDKRSFVVSQWNYGSKWADKACLVTDNFGKATTTSWQANDPKVKGFIYPASASTQTQIAEPSQRPGSAGSQPTAQIPPGQTQPAQPARPQIPSSAPDPQLLAQVQQLRTAWQQLNTQISQMPNLQPPDRAALGQDLQRGGQALDAAEAATRRGDRATLQAQLAQAQQALGAASNRLTQITQRPAFTAQQPPRTSPPGASPTGPGPSGASMALPVRGSGWYHVPGSPYHAPGKGYNGADDTNALDLNLPNDQDARQPVYPTAPGRVVQVDPRYGWVLIEHDAGSWWSGYMHMAGISAKEGDQVKVSSVVGSVSNVCPPHLCSKPLPNHLHFAVYRGSNVRGGLKSFPPTFASQITSRSPSPTTSPAQGSTPSQQQPGQPVQPIGPTQPQPTPQAPPSQTPPAPQPQPTPPQARPSSPDAQLLAQVQQVRTAWQQLNMQVSQIPNLQPTDRAALSQDLQRGGQALDAAEAAARRGDRATMVAQLAQAQQVLGAVSQRLSRIASRPQPTPQQPPRTAPPSASPPQATLSPPGPFSLSATTRCSGALPEILLSWSASPGATAYALLRNGQLYRDYTYVGSSLTFLNQEVAGATRYTYVVRAKNEAGQTRDSNPVAVAVPVCRR